MGHFSGQSDIDRVRDATDLVQLIGEHVSLKPRGREHVGLCPFHDDHSPSMAVVTHKGNAFFKCHSCGEGGDAFDFVQKYHRMDFGEALRFLADRAGIALTPRTPRRQDQAQSEGGEAVSRSSIRDANDFAAAFFRKVLQHPDAGAPARQVLAERAINEDMAQQFMLGYAPDSWDALLTTIRRKGMAEQAFVAAGLLKPRKVGEGTYDAFRHRLIFPICNEVGQPIAFGARAMKAEDEPKYLNSAESSVFQKSRTLYGLHQAKRSIIDSRTAIITEGYTDVIACHQHGFTNVVGTLGTALTREHARLLSRLCNRLILLFDGDEAGQKAGVRGFETLAESVGIHALFHERVDIQVCVLPDGRDPDDLLNASDGREVFKMTLADSTDILKFLLQRFKQQMGSATGVSGRQQLLEEFLSGLVQVGFDSVQGVRRTLILHELAATMGLSVEEINAALPKRRRAALETMPRRTAPTDSPAESTLPNYIEQAPIFEGESAASFAPSISPARRRAEHELLALLLYEPSLLGQLVEAHEQGQVPVIECIADGQFLDPPARDIARVIWNDLSDRTSFTVQELLSRLNDGAARTLATSLYFEGERRCQADARQAAEAFGDACVTLLAMLDREQHWQEIMSRSHPDQPEAGSDPLKQLQELLEFRRRHQHIAEAMPRGLRS